MKRLICFLLAAVVACGYDTPIGIPDPGTTWSTLHPIDTAVPSPSPANWPTAETVGYHYIDKLHGAATDSANTYGYPDKPRLTIPSKVYNAGDYVEVHGDGGTGSSLYTTTINPRGIGTATNPIWFKGVNRPIISGELDMGLSNVTEACYILYDGIEFSHGTKLSIRPRFANNSIHHVCLRNCWMIGEQATSDSTGIAVGASSDDDATMITQNIVIYNCEVSYFGDWDAPGEECGIYPQSHMTNLWALDCNVHHVAEDAFGGSHGGNRTSTGYYIGRCQIHDNLTNAIDIKGMGKPVVISECTIWNHYDIFVDSPVKTISNIQSFSGGAQIDVTLSDTTDAAAPRNCTISGCSVTAYNGTWEIASVSGSNVRLIKAFTTTGSDGTCTYRIHKSSGTGQGVTFHYGGSSAGPGAYKNHPEDVTFACNTVYNNTLCLRTSQCGNLRIVGNVFHTAFNDSIDRPGDTVAVELGGIRGDTWFCHNTIYGSDGGFNQASGASAYNGATTYYRSSPATYNNVHYICINDNAEAGIVGILPTDTDYWRPIRMQFWGNIFAGRLEAAQTDIETIDVEFPNNSWDWNYNLMHYSGGEIYNFGGTNRTQAYMIASTIHETNSLNSNPLFVNGGTFDLTLQAGSPAVGAATEGTGTTAYDDYAAQFPGLSIQFDRAGNARPQGGSWDIGALEYTTAAGGTLNANILRVGP